MPKIRALSIAAAAVAADAPNAMASIAAAVAEGTITPAEAGELSRLVETYIKALHAQSALQKTGDAISRDNRVTTRFPRSNGPSSIRTSQTM